MTTMCLATSNTVFMPISRTMPSTTSTRATRRQPNTNLSAVAGTTAIWRNGQEKQLKVKDTIFAAAMNCKAEGGGVPMAPNAKPDSGFLTIFYAHDLSRLKCLTLMPALVSGKHEGKKGMDLIDCDKIKIQMESPMCVHADGEHVGFLDEIIFESIPRVLKVRGF